MTLITTSRKASPVTRRLARVLSSIFECVYFNRGKSNFNSVLTQAELLGHKRIVFIYEKHGNPHEIKVLRLTKDAYKEIGTFLFNPIKIVRPRRVFPTIIYDKSAAYFVHLFIEPSHLKTKGGKDTIDITGEKGILRIFLNGNEIIALKRVKV